MSVIAARLDEYPCLQQTPEPVFCPELDLWGVSVVANLDKRALVSFLHVF